jgi:hypothetical protein
MTGNWVVTVRPVFSAGAIAITGETICYGGTPANTIGSTTAASGGDNAITYSWRSSSDSYTAEISEATSSTYLPPAGLTTTTSYRRYAKDGICNTTPTVSTGTWVVTVNNIDASVEDVSANPTGSCPDFYDFNGNTEGYKAGYSILKFRVTRSLSNADWNFDYTLSGGSLYSGSPVSLLLGNQSVSAGSNSVDLIFYIANTPGSAQTIEFKVTNVRDTNCTNNGIDETVTHTISAMPAIGSFN